MISIKKQRYNIDQNFIFGALNAFPFYITFEPRYFVPYLLVLFWAFNKVTFNKGKVIFLLALSTIIAFTNFYAYAFDGMNIFPASIFYTLSTLVIFALDFRKIDGHKIISGFAYAMLFRACITIFQFFSSTEVSPLLNDDWFRYLNTSDGRLWNKGNILGWPNVFTAFLCLSLIHFYTIKKYFFSILILIAGISTGSRMLYVALGVIFFYELFAPKKRNLFIIFFGLILIVTTLILYDPLSGGFWYRLFKISDREIILLNFYSQFLQSPFGIGNTSFSEIVIYGTYESFHSTYLKVILRYGFISLIVFMLLIYPKRLFSKTPSYYLPIIFLAISSIPQDLLFHPHLALMYIIYSTYYEKK